MIGTQSTRRRRAFPWFAGSWAAVALFSIVGCVDDPKRLRPQAGSAGTAGDRAPTGGVGGDNGFGGVAGVGEAGAAAAEAGASGSSPGLGEGGVGGEAGAAFAGDAGSMQAGSGGEGGEVDTFNEPCPISVLDGWASVAGHEFDPSLNQPAAPEVTVSNAVDLAMYAASPDPYIIHVTGTIPLPVLDVKSNKTIVGDGRDATLEGSIRIAGTSIATADMVSNVTIRNLRINAHSSEPSDSERDGIGIAYAHHVWIDHVDVWDAPGENLEISNGSDYITVSWSKIRFEQALTREGTRIGSSDSNSAEDSGRLKVTLHHDWWAGSVFQRMPRVRFGSVHVFDNYFSHSADVQSSSSYCVAAALESRVLVENNYFDNVPHPHVFFSFDSATGMSAFREPTAQMVATGNTYIGQSDDAGGKQSGGDTFTPPYTVALQPADTQLKAFVRHCSGPR
ncbi:MAG TPA: hypothetical protein VJV79_35780 [Polyangiaceae bacterium]|nr:hypothetical protein [Polyangiaceae bacterium]